MRKSRKKLIFFAIFSFFLIFSPIFADTAKEASTKEEIELLNDKIKEKKQRVEQIERSIESYKSKINEAKLESTSLKNQLSILDNHTVQIELDVEATEQKRKAIELEIKALKISIEDKEKLLSRQRIILSELLRTLYYHADKNYLEIAATYDNFSEFYNDIQYMKSIERDLGRSVKQVKEAKFELEEEKTEQEKRREAYIALKEELKNKQEDLTEQKFAKEDLLAKTKSSERTYNTLLASLRRQYQQIENEISGIEEEVRRKLEEQDKLTRIIDEQGSTVLSWPTQSRYVTAYFNDPNYPYRHVFEHNAIDIRAAHGTALRAAASGYVGRARSCSDSSCYAYVMIIHADGMSTVYGHMSRIIVSQDQFVTRGEIIGYSGGTPGTVGAGPFVTGPHLHFEVRKNGIPVNPLNYLIKDY